MFSNKLHRVDVSAGLLSGFKKEAGIITGTAKAMAGVTAGLAQGTKQLASPRTYRRAPNSPPYLRRKLPVIGIAAGLGAVGELTR